MNTSLEQIRQPEAQLVPHYEAIPFDLQNWFDPIKFAQLQRVAAMFAASGQTPPQFRGDQASCAIAIDFAFRVGIAPMMALQNMYVVHGNPGISSQLAIALAERSGVFDGPILFEQSGTGDNLAVTAKATLAKSKVTVTKTVSYKQAMDAGWPRSKEGIKPFWKAMPEQMLTYRSAVFLIRTYAPSIIMGMHTKEEHEDNYDSDDHKPTVAVEMHARLIGKTEKSVAPVVEHEVKNQSEPVTEPSKRGPGRPRKAASVEATTEEPEQAEQPTAESTHPPKTVTPQPTQQPTPDQSGEPSWEV